MPATKPQGQKPNDARHSRTTSWSTGFHHLPKGPDPSDPLSSRRRRESQQSLASVDEGPSDDLAMLRNTSMDMEVRKEKDHGHFRSRSQGQHQIVALQQYDLPAEQPPRPAPVTWLSLPRKGQLALLGLCRVFDFLQIASLQAYMFYQLKSFNENLSDSDVATQAGILQGAFTAAQFATAIPWGRVADAEWGGRRFVLLVGLVGTAISCLGVAFATSFAQAVFWRSFGGAINGTVGIIRTMIAENVKEKKYHSRAFLILPIGFNVAALFGPGKPQF